MNFNLLVSTLTHVVLLPPVLLMLGIAVGMLVQRWKPRTGRAISVASLALLFVFSTGAGARLLMWPLERMAPPLQAADIGAAGAIVILSAGRVERAPEYDGQDIPDLTALGRMRYGARLQHKTGLPLLVTGGTPPADGVHEPQARSMARALREDFRTPVRWTEEASRTTAENAAFSARMLKPHNVERILLVTDALHMARARRVFTRHGFDVVPAPTMFYGATPLRAAHFLPSPAAIRLSWYASYELVGLAWYRLREAIGR